MRTFTELVELLAKEIPEEDERAAFVKKLLNAEKTQPPSQSSSQPQSSLQTQGAHLATDKTTDKTTVTGLTQLALANFAPEILQRAERRLSEYIGAVAKVVVKRAATKARDEGELYLLIADQIEDKDERKAFIRKAISVNKPS